MHDTTAQKPLTDGAYTWRAVQPYGPSTPHRAQVEGGRVTFWQTGEGEGAHVTPAADLEDGALFAAALLEVLEGRTRYGTSPVSFQPAPAPIGRARAARLHRIMGHCGLAHAAHYAKASEATGRAVASLASLTEEEARQTWAALCAAFPQARRTAA